MSQLLFEGKDWSFETLQAIYDAVESVAKNDLALDTFPNQIEVITAEQMLDAYSSTGMPLLYRHWSFGKRFAQFEGVYRAGLQGLAYEIVINANPCISYVMEENSATMQALVIAHAAFGHNHFFKNNYQFRQWTDPGGILDYLAYAKNYIASCEERYGEAEVEQLLDAAHALAPQGVDRYPRKRRMSLLDEERRNRARREESERLYNDLWRTVPTAGEAARKTIDHQRALLRLPQENILYFLEKTAPKLASWQREILRIVRLISQYFYPQQQTKVMNEGCATYCHYRIMNALHEAGRIGDGSFLEFLQSHTNAIRQPTAHDPSYSGVNPYALGFDMMSDIARIVREPTEEDRHWFPDIAGRGDEIAVLKDVWANYRDDSFIAQFLSPHLMRKWRLFHIVDEADAPKLKVESIHNERGYQDLRRSLASDYEAGRHTPDIQIVDVDLAGSRRLVLHHHVFAGEILDVVDAALVLRHLTSLWGYEVMLEEVDAATNEVLKAHMASPEP
ncbi:SpoVR family protein [Methylocystis parvus]|uniref:SpoVR family protein n=1 Tax=Methylocystis parvus TaxID=134 RepID=A0A6B8M8U3_9HYPH|nr:SpoVR family protein [Methylocystis parvus]QGM97723.1 SpoVR family protein [Methylocystis parvus]WBK01974.1 SpoVR family protein [Methylocystis parvus OBBP]